MVDSNNPTIYPSPENIFLNYQRQIKEKEKYIIQLKRNKDFIDDDFETEQSFPIESHRQLLTMTEVSQEITNKT